MSGDLIVLPSTNVEWTIKEPDNNTFTAGPDFNVGGARCFLELFYKYACEYDLFLQVRGELTSPCVVTTSFSRGRDLFLSQTTDGIAEQKFYLIWRSNQTKLSKVDPAFRSKPFCFRVDIRTARSADKSVQTPTYLDAKLELDNLSRDFSKLLQDAGLSNRDVELACGDRTWKAHGNLLSARSDVFRTMLQTDMLEAKTGRVEIRDVEPDIFQEFLQYVYTGRLPELTVETAIRLYEIGDRYSVAGMKERCASFLTDGLTRSNACSILSLADQHNDEEFRQSVISYVLDEKIPFYKEYWSEFCKARPQLAIEVYDRLLERGISK